MSETRGIDRICCSSAARKLGIDRSDHDSCRNPPSWAAIRPQVNLHKAQLSILVGIVFFTGVLFFLG